MPKDANQPTVLITGSSGFLMPIGSMIAGGLIEPAGSELVHLESALRDAFASTIEAGGYQQALQALLSDLRPDDMASMAPELKHISGVRLPLT
jgi:hypothetical protein